MSSSSSSYLNTYVTFMSQAKGRDKLFRVFQYLRLFIIPLILKNDEKAAIFFTKFGETCGIFRKILRIGKVILNSKSCLDKIKINGLSKVTILECLSICSESLYCIVDHIILVNKIGGYKFSEKIMDFCGFHENFLWFLETIFGIAADYVKYNDYLKKGNNSEEDYTFKRKLLVNQIRLWSDIFVSTNILKNS